MLIFGHERVSPFSKTIRGIGAFKMNFALSLELAAFQRAQEKLQKLLLVRVFAQEASKMLKMAFQFCTLVGAQ